MSRQSVARMLLVLLLVGVGAGAQERASKFYDVKLSNDEVYTYANLSFQGDFTRFESPAGKLALGRTEVGVTVVIVLGEGSVTFSAAGPAQAKFTKVFGAHPAAATFTSLYMRLSPAEFERTLGKAKLTKITDELVLNQAQEVFDARFLGSFHAGPLAIIPPDKTRHMDFATVEFGQVQTEEGYWLTLRRMSPFGSVYPPSFVNKIS